MAKVVAFPKPGKPAFERQMRALAESDQVAFTKHALLRMQQRKCSQADVMRCIMKGCVTEGPFINAHGHQQATVERFMCGEELKVALAIDEQLIVITVID